VDSNETENRLRELIGNVAFGIVKRRLKNVKLEIDPEQKHILIIKDGRKHKFTFDEIEQAINIIGD